MKHVFAEIDIPHIASNSRSYTFTLSVLIHYVLLLLRFTLTCPYPYTVLGFIIITNNEKVKKNISRMMRFLSKTSRIHSIPSCKAAVSKTCGLASCIKAVK